MTDVNSKTACRSRDWEHLTLIVRQVQMARRTVPGQVQDVRLAWSNASR